MNRCVRFACPPNFEVSREEYKCKLVRQARTNAAIPGQSCLDSLKAYTLNVYGDSLKRIRNDLGSRSKNKQTSIDSLKNWDVPCAIWIKAGIISANDFTSSCQLKYRNVQIPRERVYIHRRALHRAYFCSTYYYESQCLLHFVNMTNTSIDFNNKSLIVRTDGKEILYP